MSDVRSEPRTLVISVVALVASAAHWFVPKWVALPQDASGAGLGPVVSSPALEAVAVVALVGAVLSFRFRAVGAALLGTACIASWFIVVWEFRPIVWLLSLTLTVPVVMLLAPRVGGKSSRNSRRAALVAIVAGSFVIWRGLRTWGASYGPTHPESTVAKPDWVADWLWVGAVSTTSATVTAGGLLPAVASRMILWTGERSPGPQSDAVLIDAATDSDGIARFDISNLEPETEYWYRVVPALDVRTYSPTSPELTADSSFHTMAVNQTDVTIAFGSCARTASNGVVFEAIRATNPDLFINLGDLHYANLVSSDPADHLHALGRSLSTPAQSALFSSIPSAWVWDDHDFGDNDSDANSPSSHAVSVAYRRAVPHWNVDSDPTKPINQAFTIGGVRIVITDTRSHRTADTMLGAEQEAWLIEELASSSPTHEAVVWANAAPWNVPDRPGSDQWGGFPEERRRIANSIAAAEVTNLVMISGDWHFSAIDDGTNTAFADDGAAGFPLIHGAPLDRPGARTGETYSHGVFSKSGQFGTVHVFDDGGTTVVKLISHLWNGEILGELTIDFA